MAAGAATEAGGTEGTWLQPLRGCALHLLHSPRFQAKSEVELEVRTVTDRRPNGRPTEFRASRKRFN